MHPVLLYASETWPLRTKDRRRLEVFDNRYHRSLCQTQWDHWISNKEFNCLIFGARHRKNKLIDIVRRNQLCCLWHVLRMSESHLRGRALFSESVDLLKRLAGGQLLTWRSSMKNAATALSRVGQCRLSGCSNRYRPYEGLNTLNNIARNRDQWRVCIHSLSPLTSCWTWNIWV